MERYVIHVTKRCNMKCYYCYEKDKTSDYTWKEVKQLIDNICDNNQEKEFGIEFLGGEPMLAFNLIKRAVDYMEYEREDIKVSDYIITTNGTIVHEELIKFLKFHPSVHFAISMDGTKFSNQLRLTKEGKNSYDIVVENLKNLQYHHLHNQIHFHITTHPYNIGVLEEAVSHLYDLGVRSINVGTVESTMPIGQEYAECFISEMNSISMKICSGRLKGMDIGELNYLKPKEDIRYYIRDASGKVIAESYGRAKKDITSTQIYKATPTSGPVKELIEDIREKVFYLHQNRIKLMNSNLK